MLKRISFWVIMVLITLFAGMLYAEPNINPGKWEITYDTEMPGMPMKMPAIKITQCITKEEIVPKSNQQPGQECQAADIKISGNTVSWSLICNNPGGTTKAKGKITYTGNQMNGQMNMEQTSMKITTKISGHRIGQCD
ncbi:MAG: DUF3617 family protein [Desulfobacterium sp.]|nr:DUF3617 family protein [Desulfobacterium sp.]MBU3946870.1 DUF3617 domain-containing protein [Pseudomonadota bacterium]MBU4009324.1 DUF3617 domain-containing protein [Pseudomonadota bacterium]MBU4037227.1 DUF3617 domain-containing protein [Pseudomonadota bacterium]